ncbi:MAG TPA: bifunctional 2-polyprenyl-6-hydroxyphenol methylase/3-demethylubiquinol 3-O-methyltransferase UbiG [Ktedonobacteraceae bacterium]|jgi:2-polyprenyl-6-hydroxyphenyl methylase/3-demethylubiquinone-9 3-methyltransferase|nr:bifunctional 2-polyprenyl-6-hydroxyphenol methylase/3-demethylubiquinol 3-O-methyltransferase UbiG [Ktedonobacteraceae bacterium]
MVPIRQTHKRSQEEIFTNYTWWERSCLLLHITKERCDYIESCVDRIFGRGALQQQEVLEVGSGGGLICEELTRRGAVAIGLDPSQGAIQTARSHARQSGLAHHVSFEQGYAEALPFATGSFSVIVCLDVLEHVNDLSATLNEISRVLAPGGLFIFDTINRTWLARLILIWIGERFFQKYGLVPGLHDYHHFITPHELQALVSARGLQVQELVGFTPRVKKGRLTLGPGRFTSVSYIGYATKGR